jgi:trypsin
MGIQLRRVLDTLLLLETFATLLPGSQGSHLRQLVETPVNHYNRIYQSFDAKERTIEGLTGPVVGSSLNKDVTALYPSPLIIGGRTTDSGEYPYFVTTVSSTCGATLIHPDIMLTAAHCQKVLATTRVVYVGAHELHTLATTAERRTLIRQYPHPDNSAIAFQNDVMLFQLNQPVNTLPVVTLNSDSDVPRLDSLLTAIGFGTTSTAKFVPSNYLMAVDVYPVDSDTCVRQYNVTVTVDPDTMLCAGHTSPNRDSCNGDSGGPLLDKATGEQVGIVSFGRGCGNPDFPGVYTRVSKYTSWIHDRICELSAVPPADCPTTPDPSVDAVRVILDITYDNHPTESFWRLEDDTTGQTLAFQPGIQERSASMRQVIPLPPGKYTLHFTDTAGDGICCGDGMGNIVISAEVGGKAVAEAPVAVDTRTMSHVEVLADSDGEFKHHLSLPFVVAPGLIEYTTASEIEVNIVVIFVVVAVSLIVMVTALTFVLRFCITK